MSRSAGLWASQPASTMDVWYYEIMGPDERAGEVGNWEKEGEGRVPAGGCGRKKLA